MANTFTQTPTDNSASYTAGTATDVYTAPSGTGAVGVIVGLMISNVVSSEIKVTVTMTPNAGSAIPFLNNFAIPPGTAVEILSGNKVILEAGDKLSISSDTNDSFTSFVSTLEIT